MVGSPGSVKIFEKSQKFNKYYSDPNIYDVNAG